MFHQLGKTIIICNIKIRASPRVRAMATSACNNTNLRVDELEKMTMPQLRTMSKSFGVPAKGSKQSLVLALKSLIEKEEQGQCSVVTADNVSSAIKSIEEENETSTCITYKRRGRVSVCDSTSVADGSVAVTTKTKKSYEMVEVSESKPSMKRKLASRKGTKSSAPMDEDVLTEKLSEPWTVLAHKKPQKGWIPYNPKTMRPHVSDDTKFVKLLSWNVNGLRALLKLDCFAEMAKREKFDVLCLQETKLQERDVEKIKESLIDGYENSFWSCSVSKLGYSGTAIISRTKPLSVTYGLGIPDHDSEGRIVTVEFDTYFLISSYVPNSGDGLRRLTYRVTQWDPSLASYMKELEKLKPVILTGDLNCAHQEIDIFSPATNRRSAGFTDEERNSFGANFLSNGFVDTFRRQHPGVVGYTYWGYRHGGRATNKGWRLDYFLVSESIADKVHDSYILPDIGGSDHCPIGVILKL